MTVGPLNPIPAPPLRQPQTGLIAVAPPYAVGDDVRWEGGFGFEPEGCGDLQIFAIDCGTSETKDTPEHPDPVSYDPVVLIGVDACTAMDASRDSPGRAARLLASASSAALERVLWTGEATDSAGDPGDGTERPHLADGRATVLASGDPVPFGTGLALLDQALTACNNGVQGMFEITPLVHSLAVSTNFARRENGLWVTPNGHIIVAGAGFTGGGPRPTVGGVLPAAPDLLAVPVEDQWAYATSTVYVLLGAVSPPLVDIDRSVNTRRAITERAAAAFYGSCCQFAIQLSGESLAGIDSSGFALTEVGP